MRYWAIKFTNGDEKVFRADEVSQVELLGPETVLYHDGNEYSTEEDSIEEIVSGEDNSSSNNVDIPIESGISRPIISGTGTNVGGHPLTFMERIQFQLEREAHVGRIVIMPDGKEWLVVRHVDGVLFIIQSVENTDLFSPAVHIKHSDEWKWFENREKRKKSSRRTRRTMRRQQGDPVDDYPYPVKGENDRSSCCKSYNAHMSKGSEDIIEHGFCKKCVVKVNVGGSEEVDIKATLDRRDKIRMGFGLNPIAPGTFPVFAEEQLLSIKPIFNDDDLEDADSAIGELLKRKSHNADDWTQAFTEAMEQGKELNWREEDGEN